MTDLPRLPGMRSTALPVHALRAQRRQIELVLLVTLDTLMIVLGFVLAYYLRYQYQLWRAVKESQQLATFIPTIALLVPLTLSLLAFKGLYRLPRNAGWLNQLGIVVSSVTTSIALTIVITFLSKPTFYSRLIFGFAWAAIILLLGLGRLGVTTWRRRRWEQGKDLERVLVVGGTGLAREAMRNLEPAPPIGYELVGYLDQPADTSAHPGEMSIPVKAPLLGSLSQLPHVVHQRGVDHVIVALPFWQNHYLPAVVEKCRQLGVPFQVVPDFYEIAFDSMAVQELRGMPLISLRENAIRGWNFALKRALDVGLVLLSLPFWGALSLLIMLLIKLDSRGPVIFKQTRLGRRGHPFVMYKFRTMVANAEDLKDALWTKNERAGAAFKIKRDPRLTRVGRWLRKTSLDELPQFWNVLRGEMSLVGPRPAVPEEVAQYEPWQRRRMEVMPGMTGLWQVTGRSVTSFDEQVRLDIYYAEHWSVAMDLRILLLTLPAIVSGRGAY